MTRVSIVLPAKNEASSLARLIPNLLAHMPEAEIIVVNDGSNDDTVTLCGKHGLQAITHPYSLGNGAAIKAGARRASHDIIVFMDADGQHDPADISRLLARMENGHDMVVGARRDASSQASIGRGLANKFYNRLASYITGHQVDDLTSGFRVVRADKFREFLFLLPNGFSYPTTITMAFFRSGYPVAYEPIQVGRRIGKSHIRLWKDGARFLLIIFKIGTLYSPLKLFAPVSLGMFLAATIWYIHTFVGYGRFTNMSALLYTGSVMIFLMGLISEQITALMYRDTGGKKS